jgi:hypothetical protein
MVGTASGWPIGCRIAKSPKRCSDWTVQIARHPGWPIGCGVLLDLLHGAEIRRHMEGTSGGRSHRLQVGVLGKKMAS